MSKGTKKIEPNYIGNFNHSDNSTRNLSYNIKLKAGCRKLIFIAKSHMG